MKLSGDHNQCPTCSQFFNSTYAFDKHRVGEYKDKSRRCLTVDQMTAKGMQKSARGFWVTELRAVDSLSRVG